MHSFGDMKSAYIIRTIHTNGSSGHQQSRPGSGARLLFAAKETVYKAVYPVDQVFLDYHDIEVGLADRKAIVLNGRVLELRFRDATYLVVLAFTQIFGKRRDPPSDDK